jgi:hypothetical protein
MLKKILPGNSHVRSIGLTGMINIAHPPMGEIYPVHDDFVQASKLNRLNIFARIGLVIYPKRIGHL